MKIRRLKIGLTIAIISVLCLMACVFLSRPLGRPSEDERFSEVHRTGRSYERAWSGQPRLSERFTALIHFSSPSKYYQAKFRTQAQALVASGYMVEITVPVPDLRPKVPKVTASLRNTAQQTGNYYEARLNEMKDEVRLVCRKADIPLFQKVLKEYQ